MTEDYQERYLTERMGRIEDSMRHIREMYDAAWGHHDKLHITRDAAQLRTDEELNDVRHRFIPREVFEATVNAQAERFDAATKALSQKMDTSRAEQNRQLMALMFLLIATLGAIAADLAFR